MNGLARLYLAAVIYRKRGGGGGGGKLGIGFWWKRMEMY
jgi:hypothetical protein